MKTKELTLNALFIAMTILLAVVPNLGMITVGPVSITIMHIPVIVAGLVLGFKSGVLNATVFGISALLIAATRPTGVLDVLFVNPLVSVLPRVIFGISIGVIAGVMDKFTKNFAVKATVTAILSTLIHTICVVGAMYYAGIGSGNPEIATVFSTNVLAFIGTVLMANGILEMVASALIAVPTSIVLRKIHHPGQQ
ncbi:ECF transporter S component [Erysipelothrix inopinata]|uniref:ECF transporter S component n=1 Tax=Erysipelothrix inopinata TaxID=225084 RepID=A0A7G9RZL9_9FIRM|nr:ECF transporter S component [Erysipelothrix inopinata]QNN61044.1 ECF transporter S component [Erysipelothrix inopinata]